MAAAALPLETQTLYAELLEHLLGVNAERSVGRLSGTVVEKTIKGESYLYWQASQPGGRTKQFYLGRKTPALTDLVRGFAREQEATAPDLERGRRLTAQLRAGGANLTDGPSARVIRALADAGLFASGAVLVGTHAFIVLGNALGVRWTGGTVRTQDLDIATTPDADVDIAVPEIRADVPSVLDSLKMGFLPVPPLDPRSPSTPFKVRGQALRVDLLAPRRGRGEEPVLIPRFNAAAQPLDFIEYLLQAPERALVLNGGATLVNVPSPARFALHKLLVASQRAVAFQSKSAKDIAQAATVLEVVSEARPGDIALAWQALVKGGHRWQKGVRSGLKRLRQVAPEVHERIAGELA